ncbi:MAG: response regulator transcription factor [Clostridiales bacterium]|jgi:two-component system response regulator VicR|nr:response regulator transcription factor [Clostridiales bacterium]
MAKKILIVDDEKSIVDIVKYNLKKEGFETIEAYDGEVAVHIALTQKPDLILLDVMLPEKDGFSVCREIRQTMSVPILMLTAKADEVDRILGLELGADDYILKPFSNRELVARVKANLRRTVIDENPNGKDGVGTFESNGLTIDYGRFEIRRDGKIVELTRREFELVKFLANHQGQIFSREALLEKVWGFEFFGDVRTVDVTVRRIREKLERDPSNCEYIMTKRGVGYYFFMPD